MTKIAVIFSRTLSSFTTFLAFFSFICYTVYIERITMIVNFNIKKLDLLLSDFYKLTGLTISVWDSDLHMLSHYPREMTPFCRLIRKTPLGAKGCFESDKSVFMKCLETGQPQTHQCHAGLIDTAIPIQFKDTLLGFLMFGQAASTIPNQEIEQFLKNVGKELKIDSAKLFSAYKTLDKYQPDRIQSAANILKMATRYLWLSDMIKIDNDDVIEKLNDYIGKHLQDKLTVESICKKLYISKNKLYSLLEKRFHTTIAEYIQKIRIEKAKSLLTTTDMFVYQICESVGFAEYNYFIKIFKSETGKTPLQYRKQFVPTTTENE